MTRVFRALLAVFGLVATLTLAAASVVYYLAAQSLPDYDRSQVPPMVYTPQARYEKMIEGFGGKGWFATTPDEFSRALKEALAQRSPTIVNVAIDPQAKRKPQKFEWLTR